MTRLSGVISARLSGYLSLGLSGSLGRIFTGSLRDTLFNAEIINIQAKRTCGSGIQLNSACQTVIRKGIAYVAHSIGNLVHRIINMDRNLSPISGKGVACTANDQVLTLKIEQYIALAGAQYHTVVDICAGEHGLLTGQANLEAKVNCLLSCFHVKGNQRILCITQNGQITILLRIIAIQKPEFSALLILQINIFGTNFGGQLRIKAAGKAEGRLLSILGVIRLIRCTRQRIQNLYSAGIQLQLIDAHALSIRISQDSELAAGDGLERHSANSVALPVASRSGECIEVQYYHHFNPLIRCQVAQFLAANL